MILVGAFLERYQRVLEVFSARVRSGNSWRVGCWSLLRKCTETIFIMCKYFYRLFRFVSIISERSLRL